MHNWEKKERIDRIENQEFAQDRVKEYHKLKKSPDDRIDKRLTGIAIRQDLTDEWKTRSIQGQKDFATLTVLLLFDSIIDSERLNTILTKLM